MEKVVRGWRARARPHGNSAARPLKGKNHEWTLMDTKVGRREKKGESSAWMARVGAPARQFYRAFI